MAEGLKQGARVRIKQKADLPKGEAPRPPGVWMALAPAPSGPTSWWLQAADEDSREWAATHPREVISGCIDQPALRLIPAHLPQ